MFKSACVLVERINIGTCYKHMIRHNHLSTWTHHQFALSGASSCEGEGACSCGSALGTNYTPALIQSQSWILNMLLSTIYNFKRLQKHPTTLPASSIMTHFVSCSCSYVVQSARWSLLGHFCSLVSAFLDNTHLVVL